MLNKTLFSKEFLTLCEMVEKTPSEGLTSMYYEALKNLSDDDFKRAVSTVISSKTFNKLPMPGELLSAVNGNPEDAALLALEKVEKAIREIGAYDTVIFDDPVIHAVIEALEGWEKICHMPLDEWKWVRKDFIKLYQAIGRNMGGRIVPTKLIGIHEFQNSQKGYKRPQEPKYIGNEAKAITWTNKMLANQSNPAHKLLGDIA